MRHRYECPMRWADLDMLGHVNNVTYVDYLQEARIDMLTRHAQIRGSEALGEGVVVVRHEVSYAAPLHLRERPVSIESWVTAIRAASFTMGYEVFDEHEDGSRTTYLRATTVLTPFVFAEERPRRITPEERRVLEAFLEPGPEPTARIPAAPAQTHVFPLSVRWSDVDAYGHVNNVTYVEYFQEARIAYFASLPREEGSWAGVVVAATDLDYLRPMLYGGQYAVHCWVARVGEGRSFEVGAEVRSAAPESESTVCARSRVTLVTFDREAQVSAPMPEPMRDLLRAAQR